MFYVYRAVAFSFEQCGIYLSIGDIWGGGLHVVLTSQLIFLYCVLSGILLQCVTFNGKISREIATCCVSTH